MTEDKIYGTRWFFRIFYLIWPAWVTFIAVMVAFQAPMFLLFPIPIFYLLAFWAYFHFTRHSFRFREADVVIHHGVRTLRIPYPDVTDLDNDIEPQLGSTIPSSYLFRVTYLNSRGNEKTLRLDSALLGKARILQIVEEFTARNPALRRCHHRFVR